MIYLTTALFAEGRPFIERLGLKPDKSFNKIKVFINEDVILTVTGTGVLASAAALSFVLGKITPQKGDIFANVGVCGSSLGEIVFIANKISSPIYERDFYPDMLYNSGFKEAHLISYLKPQREIPQNTLADTEGFGLAEAARHYFSAERMFFIKIASDKGDFEGVTADRVSSLVEKQADKICEFLTKIPPAEKAPELTEEEEAETLKLHLSVTSGIMLNEYLIYYKLKGGDALGLLKSLPEVKTKQEGREILEKVRKIVL